MIFNKNSLTKIALFNFSFNELPKNFKEKELSNYNLATNSISEIDLKQDNTQTHWRLKLVDFLESLNSTIDLTEIHDYKSNNDVYSKLLEDIKAFRDSNDSNQWYFKIKTNDIEENEYIFKSQLFFGKTNNIFSCSIQRVNTSRPWKIVSSVSENIKNPTPFDFKERIEYLDNCDLSFFTLVDKNLNLYK